MTGATCPTPLLVDARIGGLTVSVSPPHRPAPTVQHRIATPSKRWRRLYRSGQDALQDHRQHRLADVGPAASYLGQGGITAGGGVGALDGQEVGGGGHGLDRVIS